MTGKISIRKKRATYVKNIFENISKKLNEEFGKGFTL